VHYVAVRPDRDRDSVRRFLRLAATLLRSQGYPSAPHNRRLRGKLGAPKGITAMAHKLARWSIGCSDGGHEYVDKGLQFYEARYRQQQVHLQSTRAAKLGLQVVETDPA